MRLKCTCAVCATAAVAAEAGVADGALSKAGCNAPAGLLPYRGKPGDGAPSVFVNARVPCAVPYSVPRASAVRGAILGAVRGIMRTRSHRGQRSGLVFFTHYACIAAELHVIERHCALSREVMADQSNGHLQ